MAEVPLLEVRGLTKNFPIKRGVFSRVVAHVHAVYNIDFLIRQGETLGVVGESGSGKSTLARAAIRLIEPTSGEIFYKSQDLLALDHSALLQWRSNAQMVFQDPFSSLNPRRTIAETLGEPLRYQGRVRTRDEENEHVLRLLDHIGLSKESMYRYPHAFSGGQQQRICIGRAIALNPELIICDEPVSALDVSVQAQILNLLLELQKTLKLSYLFISHDLSVIRHMCDHVIVMYLGKTMESGPAKEIFSNPRHPYTQILLAAEPKKHPLQQRSTQKCLVGEIPSSIYPPSGCPFRTRCPFAQPICAETPPKKILPSKSSNDQDHIYHCIL